MAKGLPYSHADAVRRGLILGRYRVPILGQGVLISAVAAGAGVGFGFKVLDTLPKGNVFIQEVVSNIVFTKQDSNIIAGWTGNYSLGTTGDVDGNQTSPATDQDILLSATGALTATAGVTPAARLTNVTPFVIDNTAGTKRINLNLLVAAASITDATTGVVRAVGLIDMLLGVLP